MTIQDVKQIKLADYLQSLGYTPVKQQGKNLWYKSLIRITQQSTKHLHRLITRFQVGNTHLQL